jgi:hypothetical protein
MVKLTVIYDMDDPDKPIKDELKDWLEGNVSVQDIVAITGDEDMATITLEEMP